MQRNKGINNLSEIQKYCSEENILVHNFQKLMWNFELIYINPILNKPKSKGALPCNILPILMAINFINILNMNKLCNYKVAVFYMIL